MNLDLFMIKLLMGIVDLRDKTTVMQYTHTHNRDTQTCSFSLFFPDKVAITGLTKEVRGEV